MSAANGTFTERAHRGLGDAALREAMGNLQTHLVERRQLAVAAVPEFEQLRDQATAIKNHALANLDAYLEMFESRVRAAGGVVHWAPTAAAANALIEGICAASAAKLVIKSKSMVSEEIELNAHLEAAGFHVVETDLGEYIIQLRRDKPSHIVAPAAHLKRGHYAAAFRTAHAGRDAGRDLTDPQDLLVEARAVLRERFTTADVGITGANFLVAETGSAIIVTNEGNADLTMTLPRVHIVLATIEKMVPRLEDALLMARLLARSATGQAASAYMTLVTGAARAADADGPRQFHVVLMDNGRSAMLGDARREMLRCIRCGACMNHCPVYGAIGGHSYGWVYPGPMGSVLTPSLTSMSGAADLPNASTFCGRCESVCPVKIPLTSLMRGLRERQVERRITPRRSRLLMSIWGWVALRPALYRLVVGLASAGLRVMGRGRGRLGQLPLGAAWSASREFPVPDAGTFVGLWRARKP